MIHKINIKFPEEFTITSVTTNKSDLNVTLKKNYVPKDGDIIFSNCKVNLTGYVSIFKETKDNQLITYCDFALRFKTFSVPMLNSFLRNFSDTIELRLATEQEKAILFDNIKKEGLSWNPETKTLEEIYKPKKGDFVVINKCKNGLDCIGIFKHYNGIVNIYDALTDYNILYTMDVPVSAKLNVRKATEEEKQILLAKLIGKGFEWNYDTNKIEEIVFFNPKDGDVVFVSEQKREYNNRIYSCIGILKEVTNTKICKYVDLFTETGNLYRSNCNHSLNIVEIFRFATEEEKQLLFDKLKKNGLRWNHETKTIEKIYVPKDGDVIYSRNNISKCGRSCISIFHKIKNNVLYTHCDFCINEDKFDYSFGCNSHGLREMIYTEELRLATEDEKSKLFNKIKEFNLNWIFKTKTFEKIYIPKHGDFVHIGKRYDNDVEYLAIYDNTEIDESINEESYRSIVDIEIGNGKLEAQFDVILPTNKPIRLATEEQRQTIINVLKSEGFEWNDKTKTLEEIYVPKVGDICIAWSYKSHAIIGKVIYINNHVYSVGGEKYENCIKYESMEQYQEILNSK